MSCLCACGVLGCAQEGKDSEEGGDSNPYHSVDPAPAKHDTSTSVAELGRQLMDQA